MILLVYLYGGDSDRSISSTGFLTTWNEKVFGLVGSEDTFTKITNNFGPLRTTWANSSKVYQSLLL
jgi:hypothetical protein